MIPNWKPKKCHWYYVNDEGYAIVQLKRDGFEVDISYINLVKNRVILVPYTAEINWTTDPDARYDDLMSVGLYLVSCAEGFEGSRVLYAGDPWGAEGC